MPRTMVHGVCQECGKNFTVPLKSSTRPEPKYCSRECFRKTGISKMRNKAYAVLAIKWGAEEGHKKPRTQVCNGCGKIIDSKPSQRRIYCSRECRSKHIPAKHVPSKPLENPRMKRSIGSLNWQRKLARDHFKNKCCRCGYDLIPEILEVHHKDRNPRNRMIENLELLCPNCHEIEHFNTKTGRFQPHGRREKKPYHETYAFQKYASDERVNSVNNGTGDPGPQ